MKIFVKKLLRYFFLKLPWGAKKEIKEACYEHYGYDEIISEISNRCKITSLIIEGEYGLIEGSPHDQVILPEYRKTGFWSKKANDYFVAFFEKTKGATYLDIGANIGLTTIPISRNPNVKCYCFEPEPVNYSYLEKNIRNNCPNNNVVTKNFALFDKASKLSFELSPMNHGDHRIRLEDNFNFMGEKSWKTIEIDAFPLDQILNNIDGPIAAKIDTQGAEPFVVAGGMKVLSKVDMLVTEFSPYWMARMGGDQQILIDYIKSFQHVKITDPRIFVGDTLSGIEAAKKLTRIIGGEAELPTMKHWDIIAWNDVS